VEGKRLVSSSFFNRFYRKAQQPVETFAKAKVIVLHKPEIGYRVA
jgi:hypothetical protein